VSVSIKPIVADHDLPLVGNMRRHSGNELQIIHCLLLGAHLAIAVADLGFRLMERQLLQRRHRPSHVLAHPLGLGLSPGAHPAVDGESRVLPGENPRRPLPAEQLAADKKRQHLAGEDFGEPGVVDPRDLLEKVLDFPEGPLEPCESPDFIVENGIIRLGIEVTRLHKAPDRQGLHLQVQGSERRLLIRPRVSRPG